MKLSIVIPVFNERETILPLIDRINGVELEGTEKEIIVVDDASDDGTASVLREKVTDKTIVKLYHQKKLGKGAAIRTALEKAEGDLVIIQDGDLEYDPRDYPRLLDPVLKGKAGVVFGSRFLSRGSRFAPSSYLANRFLTFLTNLLYGARLTDMETCYKLFEKKVLGSITIEAQGFEFEPEITAKLLKKGYAIMEVPISYCARTRKKGKKITFKDGMIAVFTLFRHRFRYG